MAAGCWRRTKGHRKPSSRHPTATHVIRSSRTCTTRFATNLPGPERSDSNCPSHERVGLAAERKCRGDQRGSLVSVVFPTADRGFESISLQQRVGGKPVRRWRATAARTTGTVKSATIAVGRTTRRSEYHVLSAWTAGPSDPIMGQPIQGLTPDRSRIRPKSRPARRCHPCSRGLSAGAPPRLGKGHPSSAAHRSDPPLTELAPLSPRGRGAGLPAP
jgi:hypothetical protein